MKCPFCERELTIKPSAWLKNHTYLVCYHCNQAAWGTNPQAAYNQLLWKHKQAKRYESE